MNKLQSPSRLNSGTIMLAFVAIMVGLSATYAFRVYSRETVAIEQPPPKRKKPVLTTVPLASRDIPAGTAILLDDVALYKMTAEEIKARLKSTAFMTNPTQIIGKIARSDIKRGAAFTTEAFYPTGQRPGISRRLSAGLRAVTIEITAQNALLGYATPGSSVDVLFQYGEQNGSNGKYGAQKSGKGFYPDHHDYNPPRRRDYYGNTIGGAYGGGGANGDADETLQGATTTLVQDVEVLAVGSQSLPTDAASTLSLDEQVQVTLAVTPRQAELIRVAKGHGELSLALRSSDDDEQVPLVDPVTVDHIIGTEESVHQMEIYRGRQVTKLHFNHGRYVKQRIFADTSDDQQGSQAAADTNQLPHMPFPVPTFVPVFIPPTAMPGTTEAGRREPQGIPQADTNDANSQSPIEVHQ